MFGYVFEGDLGEQYFTAILYDNQGKEVIRERFPFTISATSGAARVWLSDRGANVIIEDSDICVPARCVSLPEQITLSGHPRL